MRDAIRNAERYAAQSAAYGSVTCCVIVMGGKDNCTKGCLVLMVLVSNLIEGCTVLAAVKDALRRCAVAFGHP